MLGTRGAAIAVIGALGLAVASRAVAEQVGSETSLSADELDRLCRDLASDDVQARTAAARRIVESGPSSLPVLRQRLARRVRARPADMFEVMEDFCPVEAAPTTARRDAPCDMLAALLGVPRNETSRQAVTDATEIVALLRALADTGTDQATLSLVEFAERHRGVFRVEVAREVVRMGDRATPGLILLVRGENRALRPFATRMLERIGRATYGEQVRQTDPQVLARVLAAYGESADPGAVSVLLSFSGSEDAGVRNAARTSLAALGSAILWPARAQYESFTGQEPPRAWGSAELARRLFDAQDRARLAQAEQAMALGLAHAAAGRYPEMLEAYEQILGRWPLYERRTEMVPGIIAYGEALQRRGERVRAREMFERAVLLDPEGSSAPRLRGRVMTLDGEDALARGVADTESLQRAAELDRGATAPLRLLRTVRERTAAPSPYFYRSVAAVGLLLFALACLGLLVVRAWPPRRGRPGADGTLGAGSLLV